METRVTEVADAIHQLSTYIPEANFGFNQYLITADEPLLFHTGMRGTFPLVAEAAAKVLPMDSLRWITFGHVEADECGAMNEWLGHAPHAQVAQRQTGCMVSIGDLADREPRALSDGESGSAGGDLRQPIRRRSVLVTPTQTWSGFVTETVRETLRVARSVTETLRRIGGDADRLRWR